jgi:hypothetical protein
MNCTHERKHFCKFRYEAKGETRWHKTCQCLDCGQRIKPLNGGTWWAAEPGEKVIELPEFDLIMLDTCNRNADKQRFEQYAEQRKSDFLKKHEEYEKYLQSDTWREKRRLVLNRCGNICECCLRKNAIQVHHTNYKTLFDEVAWDLKGVCIACHKRLHNIIDVKGIA